MKMPASKPKFALRRYRFAVFGTGCELSMLARETEAADAFAARAADWLREVERRFSRYRGDSLVSRVNRRAGRQWSETDPDFDALLDRAREAWEASDGAVDITALPLYRLWHGDDSAPPSEAVVRECLDRVGFPKIERRAGAVFLPVEGMAIDLGGIAKEYAVDHVAEWPRPPEIDGLLVAIGGDLRAVGACPSGGWRVGLEAPSTEDPRLGHLRLHCGAVATSGTGRRGRRKPGGRVPHIIDPRNGRPASGPSAVTVFAPTCFEAGVQATAACLTPDADTALRQVRNKGLRGLVTDASGTPRVTDGETSPTGPESIFSPTGISPS